MNEELKYQIWDALLVEYDTDELDRLLTANPRAARELSLLAELFWSVADTDQWLAEGGKVLMRLADVILQHGADLEDRLHEGLTPLMLAAKRGNTVAAEFLIQRGSILEARDDQGQNILHFAADGRDEYMMKLCLAAGLDPNLADNAGQTPLHILFDGSYSNASRLTALLLSRGASVQARDDQGQTVLHLLAKDNYFFSEENLRRLLTAGADPFAVADDGSTPWSLAAQDDNAHFHAIVRDEHENYLSAFGESDSAGRWCLHFVPEAQALDAIRRRTAGYFSLYADEPRRHGSLLSVYAWGAWFLVPSEEINFDGIQRFLAWGAPRPSADYLRLNPISALLWTEQMCLFDEPMRLLGPKIRLDKLLMRM